MVHTKALPGTRLDEIIVKGMSTIRGFGSSEHGVKVEAVNALRKYVIIFFFFLIRLATPENLRDESINTNCNDQQLVMLLILQIVLVLLPTIDTFNGLQKFLFLEKFF